MGSPENDGPRTVSVSKDYLRAELTQLKLDLVSELATRADVNALAGRVLKLEEEDSPSRVEFDALKSWMTGVRAVVAVLAAVALACLPLLVRHYTG